MTELEVGEKISADLEKRLGRLHFRRRVAIEERHADYLIRRGFNISRIENWYSVYPLIRNLLKVTGLYWRGFRNTAQIQIRHNRVKHASVPKLFKGFRVLQISDLHADMSELAIRRLTEILPKISYDVCVLTGDYRGETYAPCGPALSSLARVRAALREPIYGVLGNHDTIDLLLGLEEMGVRMLLNESVAIERGGERIHLAGVDDAHYYRAHNIEKAIATIPHEEFSVLLSHTPEIYRQAAHYGCSLMLSGHTHGGQICLPGGIPIRLNAVLPRHMGSGPWNFLSMIGYTSVGVGVSGVPVRFNCPPEITLHYLEPAWIKGRPQTPA
jgi:predicted MPP superfamily phosphohydrolase